MSLKANPQNGVKRIMNRTKVGIIKVEMMHILHNESQNLLVQVFEKNHHAKRTAQDFLVSLWTVYHLHQRMK